MEDAHPFNDTDNLRYDFVCLDNGDFRAVAADP